MRQAGIAGTRAALAVRPAPRTDAPGAAVAQALQRAHRQGCAVPARHVVAFGRVLGNGAVQRAITGGRPTLHIGSTAPAVRVLQQELAGAGASLAVDGAFGPKTQAAVMAFQRAAGVAADGVVGPKTWARIATGGVQLGRPEPGAGPAKGSPATLAAAKLAELSTLVRQVKERGARPGAGASAAGTPALASVPAGAWGRDDESWLDEAAGAVGSAVSTVSDAAGGIVDSAIETAEGVVDSVVDTASAVATTVTDTAGQVVGGVGNAVGSAIHTVTEAVGGAVDTVADTVGSVADTAGEAWTAVKATASEVAAVAAELTDDVKRFLGDGYTALTGILKDLASGLGLGPTGLGALNALLAKLKKMVAGQEEEGQDYSGSIDTVRGGVITGNGGCDDGRQSPAGGRRVPLRASLGLQPSTRTGRIDPAATAGAAADRVDSRLSVTSRTERQLLPLPESAFGYAMPAFSLTNGLWRTNSSWWSDHVDITATVDLTNTWDMQDRGRQTIKGADDEKINAGNWRKVIDDLTPAAGGAPKRHDYWAPGPTSAHEQFHCRDYTERAEAYLQMATDWLMTQQVDVPFLDTEPAVRRQVKPLLEQLAAKFAVDAKHHLGNGGEARAYAATRGGYDTIVNGIWTRAVHEHWV